MSEAFTLEKKNGVAYLTFDLINEKVNTINLDILDELDHHLDTLIKEENTSCLVIKSGKKDSFIAGADLHSFEKAFKDLPLAEKLVKRGHQVFNKLASTTFPTIAIIDGICLGGGTELALACQYRIACDSPKTQIGLPEVMLGIMPGWGGTQRLPRLVGLEQGLKLILSGKAIDAKKAYKIHLVDEIAAAAFLEKTIENFINKVKKFSDQMLIHKKRSRSGFRHFLLEGNPLGRSFIYWASKRNVLAKTKGHYPAPLVAIRTIKETFTLPLDKGLKKEVLNFASALSGDFRHAIQLINVFFMQEEIKKNPGIPNNAKAIEIKKGGVVGAGTMGAGISWLFSYRDIPVRFKDINWEAVGKGYGAAYAIYKKLLKIRKLKPYQVERKFQLISGTIDYSGFSDADLIIEAATENLELKHKIFEELEHTIHPDAIVASNTSSLTIDGMAKHMKHPERFLGMHFFNPPNRMPLVEIIAGNKTSSTALATAVAFCKMMKKVPLIVKDCPGFLVNRVFAMAANEACLMLEEGVPMEHLDEVMQKFGMPMGPFVLADEVGNDIAHKVFSSFSDAYGERMKPPQIIKAVYDAKLLGKKTGKGYYIWKGKKREKNPEIQNLIDNIDTKQRKVSDEDIVDRIILAMVNEAARCLEENVVKTPSHVDIGMIFGIGFPPFRGGLLRYADDRGIFAVHNQLKRFEGIYGMRFSPCDKIAELAKSGGSFYTSDKAKNATEIEKEALVSG